MILRYSCSDFATSHFGQFAGSSIYRRNHALRSPRIQDRSWWRPPWNFKKPTLGCWMARGGKRSWLRCWLWDFLMDFWGHSWFSYLFWGAEYGLLSIAYCSLVWLRAFDDQLTDISCDLLKTQALSALLGTVPQLQSEADRADRWIFDDFDDSWQYLAIIGFLLPECGKNATHEALFDPAILKSESQRGSLFLPRILPFYHIARFHGNSFSRVFKCGVFGISLHFLHK